MKNVELVSQNDPSDLYALIRLFGRKIQHDYLHNFITLSSNEAKGHTRFMESRHDTGLDEKAMFITPRNELFPKNLSEWFYDITREETLNEIKYADLSKDIVLARPWNMERFERSIYNIGENRPLGEFKYDESNHHICLWEPIGIATVWGGNHSLTSGILKCDGSLPYKHILKMSKIYESIYCDGEYYYKVDSKKKIKLCKVNNLEFAIIFAMGRILDKNGITYKGLDKSK